MSDSWLTDTRRSLQPKMGSGNMLLTAPTQGAHRNEEQCHSQGARPHPPACLQPSGPQCCQGTCLCCEFTAQLTVQEPNTVSPSCPVPRVAERSCSQLKADPRGTLQFPAAHTALGSHTGVKETFLRALAAGSAALQQTAAAQHGPSLAKALQRGRGALRRPRAPQAAAPRGCNTRSSLLGFPLKSPDTTHGSGSRTAQGAPVPRGCPCAGSVCLHPQRPAATETASPAAHRCPAALSRRPGPARSTATRAPSWRRRGAKPSGTGRDRARHLTRAAHRSGTAASRRKARDASARADWLLTLTALKELQRPEDTVTDASSYRLPFPPFVPPRRAVGCSPFGAGFPETERDGAGSLLADYAPHVGSGSRLSAIWRRPSAPTGRLCFGGRWTRGQRPRGETKMNITRWTAPPPSCGTAASVRSPCSSPMRCWRMRRPWRPGWRRRREPRCTCWETPRTAGELEKQLCHEYPNIIFSQVVCGDLPGPTLPGEVRQFGRRFHMEAAEELQDCSMFYVGAEGLALTSFMLTWNRCPFSSFDPATGHGRRETLNVNRALMRRLYLVERARDARVVGILVGTLGVAGYLDVLQHLRQLVHRAGKRSYMLSVGKPNPAKLANFLEVDIFVLVACAQNSLLDSSDFYRPIVTPYELELACNPAREWTGNYLTDFRDLLPGACAHIELPPAVPAAEAIPDVSLITGEMRTAHLCNSLAPQPPPSTTLACRDQTRALAEISPAATFLESRSWRGLEQQLGKTTVSKAVQGRRGIAIAYEDEGREQS
uniref:2-(3-amino-3-carboxypropyl)histidine synthase subunit 2 n=1 Tax=Meleagris gallopavo TaxID=9103 RepID=A0A803XLU5_MELGA